MSSGLRKRIGKEQPSDKEREQERTKPTRKLQWMNKRLSLIQLIIIIFPIRLFNALTLKTYFQPDEYYQCLEVAHRLVFGTGYITWEWREELRSGLHPLIYAIGYQITKYLPEKWESDLVVITPKVMGAIIATISEVGQYKFVLNYTENNYYMGQLVMWLSIMNPFNMYFITRSFSNGFEMCLISLGLSFWPWNYRLDYRRLTISCFIGFMSILIRPTNGIIWGFLGIEFLIRNYHVEPFSKLVKLVGVLMIEFGVVLGINIGIDYYFYEVITIPIYNFFEFNVIKNLSIFYGVAPWHFHIFQSIPILLMTYLPFFLHSFTLKRYRNLHQLVLIVVIGFLMISHKEFRFLYPIQPILILLVAGSINQLQNIKILVYGIILVNILIGIFFTQIHERGVIDVVNLIKEDSSIKSVGILTPCHSTPWQSHLHRKDLEFNQKTIWSLTCEPPLHLTKGNLETILNYRDESDQFYDNPIGFIESKLPQISEPKADSMQKSPGNKQDRISGEIETAQTTDSSLSPKQILRDNHQDSRSRNRFGAEMSNPTLDFDLQQSENQQSEPEQKTSFQWPQRLIIFAPLESFMDEILAGHYTKCHRLFNLYFHWDDRRHGDIIVYCKNE